MKPLKQWPWVGIGILLVLFLLTAVASYQAGRMARAKEQAQPTRGED